MIKPIKTIIFFIVLALINTCNAQVNRSIDKIIVQEKSGAIVLTELIPDNYWVLVIVDKNLNTSQKMLNNLNNDQLNLDKIIIMIIDSQSNDRSLSNENLESLVFAWLEVKDSHILTELKLSATPIILGMKGHQVDWKVPGTSSESEFKNMIYLINKWSQR